VTAWLKQDSLFASLAVGGRLMRAGLVVSTGLATIFWASEPLAQTVADSVEIPAALPASLPIAMDTVAQGLGVADSWVQERRGEMARTWSRAARLTYTATPDVAILPANTAFVPVPEMLVAAGASGLRVDRTDLWRAVDGGGAESLRLTTASPLRRADGAPIPPTPFEQTLNEPNLYDVRYDYHWPAARTTTASGWQVDLTPHAGVGYGTAGGSAQAGATLRLGPDLSERVPNGAETFGDRGRWYLFAAGEGRAVGYNFARNRDGGFDRSGLSQDRGAFLGDATVGVAWRRGPMQASVGLTYREIEVEGLRLGRRDDDSVDEGLLAFQLSIRPE
jgi:hypothetical protein